MENLNAEMIKKALECCTSESSKCADCPRYSFVPCTKSLLTDALSLIKELTEENERLRENNLVFAHGVEKVAANYYNLGCTDTAKKMQELIAEHATNGYPRKVRLDVVDQITKEMLKEEEKND